MLVRDKLSGVAAILYQHILKSQVQLLALSPDEKLSVFVRSKGNTWGRWPFEIGLPGQLLQPLSQSHLGFLRSSLSLELFSPCSPTGPWTPRSPVKPGMPSMPGRPMGPGGAWMASAIGVWPGAPCGPEKPVGRCGEWKCQMEAKEAARVGPWKPSFLPHNCQLFALLVCPHSPHWILPGQLSACLTQHPLCQSISPLDWYLLEGGSWVVFILSSQGPTQGLVYSRQVKKCLL